MSREIMNQEGSMILEKKKKKSIIFIANHRQTQQAIQPETGLI
jgi:hypothetical protein